MTLKRTLGAVAVTLVGVYALTAMTRRPEHPRLAGDFDQIARNHAETMLDQGKQTFRFDTCGDEAFSGDLLRRHEAVAGANHGGVGPGLCPNLALALGLKV